MKLQKNPKIKVTFTNEKVYFETYFTGDINHLREKLDFIVVGWSDFIYAYKTFDRMNFTHHRINDYFIEFGYDFTYCSDIHDNINLKDFKRLVKPYNFKVINMTLIKEEKKEKKK